MLSCFPYGIVTAENNLRFAELLFRIGLTESAFAVGSKLKAMGKAPSGTDILRARCRIRRGQRHEAYEMLKEELRLHPDSRRAERLLRQVENTLVNDNSSTDEFGRLYSAVRPYTMVWEARLRALYLNARRVCAEDVQGNFVECGVAAGGSSALLAYVIKHHSKRPRLLYCFDTFEGMPEPTPEDMHQGIAANDSGWGAGTCSAPTDSLMKAVERFEASNIVRPVQGLFRETLPATREAIGSIALLHLDGDWYESTKDILNNLYSLVVSGGYLQVDDYGHWDGCRKAVDEFLTQQGAHVEKTIIDESGVSFSKP